MVLLNDLQKETIKIAIEQLIGDNYLELVFDNNGTIISVYGKSPVFGGL